MSLSIGDAVLTILKTDRYERWIGSLRDRRARVRIMTHFYRIETHGELMGDWKAVGGGVIEMRFHYGPGYRVYLTRRGGELVVLLAGGDKPSQLRDIEEAKRLAQDWR